MKTAGRGMSAREMLSSLHMKNGGDIKPTLKTGKGGIVPGKGKGDKIPAKYEPGEYVVSNAMLAAVPGLREQLDVLREKTLAQEGKTPQQADARAMLSNIGGIRAKDGGWFSGTQAVLDGYDEDRANASSIPSTSQSIGMHANAAGRMALSMPFALMDDSIVKPLKPVVNAAATALTGNPSKLIDDAPKSPSETARDKLSSIGNPNYSNEGRNFQATDPSATATTPTPEKSAREILGAMPQNTSQAGVMRYDVAGKSPLYTNRTDENGIKDNERLVETAQTARDKLSSIDSWKPPTLGNVWNESTRTFDKNADTRNLKGLTERAANEGRSAQNQYAVENILNNTLTFEEGREAARQQVQWNREVADAQAINQATNDQIYRSQNGEKAYRDLLRIRNDQQRIGNEAQANQDNAQTARQRLSDISKTNAIQNQQAQNMDAAQKALLDAKTPDESSKAAEILRTLMGKDKPAPMPRATVVAGGQVIDPITGQITTAPSAIYDNQTGQFIERPQQKSGIAPKVGEVREGYRFKGGNPWDKNSWEEVR